MCLHVYDKENLSSALQTVTDLLLRWSQSGAPPVASTATRNTRSLWWLHISNEKQISTQARRPCTANRQTPPSMMVGSPRNLQGCMHHTHLPVGVFEACGDCCGICVCREMSIRVSKSKTPSRVEISLTIFFYPYRFYFPVLLE